VHARRFHGSLVVEGNTHQRDAADYVAVDVGNRIAGTGDELTKVDVVLLVAAAHDLCGRDLVDVVLHFHGVPVAGEAEAIEPAWLVHDTRRHRLRFFGANVRRAVREGGDVVGNRRTTRGIRLVVGDVADAART